MGSVTYFTPVFTQSGSAEMDDSALEMMTMFLETIKASNANILNQNKEAVKAKATSADIDLAADFN
jgi:hypothetical protein